MKWHFPKKEQWANFLKILTTKEKIFFFVCLFLMSFSAVFLIVNFWFKNTKIIPAEGGIFTEGIVGFPQRINPLYPSNLAEMDTIELIFAGLMEYHPQGKLETQLAKDYKILEEGRVYEFELKDNLFWQDGTPLTTDDVLFTVSLIQNPEVKSPFRSMWAGIEVEKVSDKVVRFKLKNKSGIFLENCTFKILPKHLLETVPPQSLPFAPFNLNPIGAGPYKIKEVQTDKDGKIVSLTLSPNPYYPKNKPYLEKIVLKFYEKEEDLVAAYSKKEIDAFAFSNKELLKGNPQILESSNLYQISLPRYFAVFFNLKNSKILADFNVRMAINYATNKEEIKEKVFAREGEIIDSPILPQFYGFKEPKEKIGFDLEKAKEILKNASFEDKNGDGFLEKTVKRTLPFTFERDLKLGSKGEDVKKLQECLAKDKTIYPEGEITGYFGQKTKEAVMRFQEKYKEEILLPQGLSSPNGEVKKATREKLNEFCFGKETQDLPLQIRLVSGNEETLTKIAMILKEQWEKAGIKTELEFEDRTNLETKIIPKRDYDAFLFGEMLKITPDPFPFWHSSQIGEMGLNLSNYENKEVDKLLEKAREKIDDKEREETLEDFQNVLLEDLPAVFLLSPNYYYLVRKEVKGVFPEGKIFMVTASQRFSLVENWYINTKRVIK